MMAIVKINPYSNIDFSQVNNYKAALHTHIRAASPDVNQVIQKHIDYGFDIYTRTEKDIIEIPSSSDIYIIPAYERVGGAVEHSIVLFPNGLGDYQHQDQSGAVQWRAHPHDPGRPKYSVSEMASQFSAFDSLVGLEIISRNSTPQFENGDSVHPHRRGLGNYVRASKIWSELMINYGINKIYGLGVTDGYNDFGPDIGSTVWDSGYTFILADELTEEKIKTAFNNGNLFFVSHMDRTKQPPKVTNVVVTENNIELTIAGEYAKIYWLYDGNVLGEGDTFDLTSVPETQKYVRFEVWSNESDYWDGTMTDPDNSNFYTSNVVGGQPFIFNIDGGGGVTLPEGEVVFCVNDNGIIKDCGIVANVNGKIVDFVNN